MRPHPFQAHSVQVCKDLFYSCYGKWREEISLQVRQITQSQVKQLRLYENHRATILKEIAHINFTALTCLNLGGNNIQSIQGLTHVQMAHIEQLYLWSNDITSVGVMRKAAWPALKGICIENNYFGEAKKLVEGCFPQIRTLYVYYTWEDGEDKNRLTEQCFPAKMQAVCPQFLSIREHKFCLDRSIKRVLKKRWPHVQIE